MGAKRFPLIALHSNHSMNYQDKYHSSGKQGFTFTEVLITLGLFIALAGVGVGAYFRYYNFALVDSEIHNSISLMNKARFLAQKNADSSDYGIHLDPVIKTITLFKSAYVPNAPGNEVASLSLLGISEISLSPVPGVSNNILFERGTGKTVNAGTFTIGNGEYSYTFHINSQGVVD